jgi:hypothetical protein
MGPEVAVLITVMLVIIVLVSAVLLFRRWKNAAK